MPRIKAAIYCRLSKEDAAKTGPESESIQNQRSMLLRYAAEHGYTVQEVYIDEDYSGRRPPPPGVQPDAGGGRTAGI